MFDPLEQLEPDPVIAAIPKADLHVHQEIFPRLDRLVARREGRPPFDWRGWARQVMAEVPPGLGRLGAVYQPDATLGVTRDLDRDPEVFIARVVDLLEESAADGAVLVEVQFGQIDVSLLGEMMARFREAERRVQRRYPRLRAEAIGWLNVVGDPHRLATEERQLEGYLAAARTGLAGVNFRVDPYDTEADPALWAVAYRWAERAAGAGLGIAVHAGEFSTANLAAALRVPGLARLGHAVHAASDPRLLDELARSGATVECSLTCNVVLGAVPSHESHPIRQFVARGIPVTLNTDLPVHLGTTIGREYAVAGALGFSPAELLEFARNAVRASFAGPERRAALLAELAS